MKRCDRFPGGHRESARNRWIGHGAATLLAAGFALALHQSPAHADTYTVTEDTDAADFSPGDGSCDTDDSVGDGPCTLRAAIQEANASGPGPHVITIDPSYTQLFLGVSGDGEDLGATGDLDVTSEISIVSTGTEIIIEPAFGGFDDRAFDVHPAGDLTVDGIGVKGTSVTGDGGAYRNTGTLDLTNASLSGGVWTAFTNATGATGAGGAIHNGATGVVDIRNANANSVALVNAGTASGNGGVVHNAGTMHATGTADATPGVLIIANGSAVDGAGIHNSGALDLGCETGINANSASGGGGGLYNTVAGDVTFSGSLDGNDATNGGGLYNLGTFEAQPCADDSLAFSTNTASQRGGGLYNDGDASLSSAVVSSNAAVDGAGVYVAGGSLDIGGFTQVRGNIAGENGAGMYVADGSVTMPTDASDADTLRFGGNSAGTAAPAPVEGYGGAVAATGTADIVLSNVRSGGDTADGLGGAVHLRGGATMTVESANLSQSSADRASAIHVGGDATLALTNATIHQASDPGYPLEATEDASVVLEYVTFAQQSRAVSVDGTAGVEMRRSLIVAWNDDACTSGITFTGANATNASSCSGPGVVVDSDVDELDEVDDESGVRLYYLPRWYNPAVDLVTDCGGIDDDQRFAPRPRDGDGVDGPACDAGAIEAASPPFDVHTVTGTVSVPLGLEIDQVCVIALPSDFDDERDEPAGYDIVDGDRDWSMNLPEGDYYFLAFPCSFDRDGDVGLDFSSPLLPEWYRDAAVDVDSPFPPPDGAEVVYVGDPVPEIDFCLADGPGVEEPCQQTRTLSGTITAPQGTELGQTCAIAVNLSDAHFAAADATGRWSMEVPANAYWIGTFPCIVDAVRDEDDGYDIDLDSELLPEWYADTPVDVAEPMPPPPPATVVSVLTDRVVDTCLGSDPERTAPCVVEPPPTTTTTEAPPTTTEPPAPTTTEDPVVDAAQDEASSPGTLAFTGSSTYPLTVLGLLLVMTGGILVGYHRRRLDRS